MFGEHIIGRVEAATRPLAERAAVTAFGQRHAVARIQSLASYEIGCEERRVADQRRRPTNDDEDDGA